MEMEHQHGSNATTNSCANCGIAGDVSLKTCKSCMLVRYCNATCQLNHWATHKTACKQRAAELRDMALFKDPPRKEDCPICFLPMSGGILSCVSLPTATILSVPINDNEELAENAMEQYYPCCGKSICVGCIHSFAMSGNIDKCPFCKSDRGSKTDEENVEQIMKRVEANDPASIYVLAGYYQEGRGGFQQDHSKAMDLYARAADLGFSKANMLTVLLNIGN